MSIIEAPRAIEAHKFAREENEHYVEPFWCSERLFVEERFEGLIWDPCCGFGRIPDSARAAGFLTVASDIIDRGYRQFEGARDFLSVAPPAHCKFNVVCNPPFAIAPAFAMRALELGAEKVAMIFPTARLNAAHWLRGTPLARVWLMTPRPSMPPGHTITAGEKPQGGKMDFCWLVWAKHWPAGDGAVMKWLRRDA